MAARATGAQDNPICKNWAPSFLRHRKGHGRHRGQVHDESEGCLSIRNVRVGEIVVDAGTQVRAAINESAVSEYAEAMRDGDEFPPIILFADGNRFLCADGFHRTLAAARISRDTLKAEVRQGSKQ